MQVLSFDWRSPFSIPSMIGVPPSHIPAPVTGAGIAGLETSSAVAIPNAGIADLNSLLVAPPAAPTTAPQSLSTTDALKYGDAITTSIVFGGAGEQLVLRRPTQTRTELLIQNLSVLGNIFYCFDRPADNISCIAIAAGGNRLFDEVVPQGDLHIFSTGAGIVIIEFINQSLNTTTSVG